MAWVLGALCVGALLLVLAAYWLTLDEIDEVLNDGLKQTALLLADRDLRGAISPPSGASALFADTESQLVAIARRLDGSLLFTSEPAMSLHFEPRPGISIQPAMDTTWYVFTLVQGDRTIQVAQPSAVRRESAAESASQLLVPIVALIALTGVLLVTALRRGLKPLARTSEALAQRHAQSLEPLDPAGVPEELLPMVGTLNDLLGRLRAAFEAQRHFVADAAHELRSPVTALQLQVQVLERSRDPQERALATAELSAGIGRARRLIEQLLHLSRASADASGSAAFASDSVLLAELARTVVVRWAAEAERCDIDLGVDAPSELSIQGDAAQLEILLSNLVENALRYARAGGIVDVVAGRLDGAPVLRVIDDGPGIAPAERERVFDRFYRSPEAVARSESGSGLGLAIVRSIAAKHGAVVSLHAGRGGRGLEVRVAFPAA